MLTNYISISLFLLYVVVGGAVALKKKYFMAAVYEHPRWGDGTSAKPHEIILENTRWYIKATREAKLRGAEMIVFPEYGLFPPGNRERMKSFLEEIPDPKTSRSNPCDEPLEFKDRPILYTLSCFAQSNQMVIVANTGGFENCTGEPDCPSDGRWNFNANTVFDKDGTILARYYKERLFFEHGMDLPRTPQDPFFQTDLGKFATFVCFDIMFEKMAKVGEMEGIDAIVFPTMWLNAFPFFTATQWWQAWAIGSNANILAANLHLPGDFATGSGIYNGRVGAEVSTISHDGIPKLLIAPVTKRYEGRLPKPIILAFTENGTEEWSDGDGQFPPTCSFKRLGPAKDFYKDYRCLEEDVSNFTLFRLTDAKGKIKVCNSAMCCYLEYDATTMDESYYLGVFNGTHNAMNHYYWAEEDCFVGRCDELKGVPCATFPTVSNTVFRSLRLSANFSTHHVYPSVVGSQYKLMPYQDWNFSKSHNASALSFKTTTGFPLLMATLKGRAYQRDPPYKR